MEDKNDKEEKLLLDDALDKTGFGLYSYLSTMLTGLVVISMVCVGYGTTFLAPASACELETTTGQQGLIVAAPSIGMLIGGSFWGYLGDTKGRRNMLLLSLVSSALINALSSLSVNWIMLVVLQFIAALISSAKYTLGMTLLSESVPLAKRNLVVLLVSSIFMLSQGVMAVLAMPVIPLNFSYYLPSLGIYWNSWRTLVLVYSAPSFISAIWLFFMQESPKFVLMKGDEQRTLEILRNIHRLNNGRKKEFEVTGLILETSDKVEKSSVKNQLVPLFKAPLLKYTILLSILYLFQVTGLFVSWLPTIANQVIRMYETGEVIDATLCTIINTQDIEVPVDPDAAPCALHIQSLLVVLGFTILQSIIVGFLTLVVVGRAGRRNTVMGVSAVIGVCGILVNLVPNIIGTSVLFIIYMMGMIVLGMYTAITVALFPTHLKATAVAFTMTIGRLKSFAGIQVVNYLLYNDCEVGFYIFGAIFASSAIVASFLPDDRLLKKKEDEELEENTDDYVERL